MAGNIYSEDWQKKNMKGITVKYKIGFVEEFKNACDKLGVTQSGVIRTAMTKTIDETKGITDSSFTKFMCDKYMSNEHRLGELQEKRFMKGLDGFEKNLYKSLYEENEQIEKMFNDWFRSLYLKYKEKYPNTGKACLTFNYNSMYTHEFIDKGTKMIKVNELLDFVARSYGV